MRNIKQELIESTKKEIEQYDKLLKTNPKSEELKALKARYEKQLAILEGKDDLQNTVRKEN